MVIDINKNIDNYRETVVLGLTAKQLIYSILSVAVGGGIVLLLYQKAGLTVSAYIAIPAVTPIALSGFYSYNGMGFMEMMKLKIHFAFGNRALAYVSTEGEDVIREIRQQESVNERRSFTRQVCAADSTNVGALAARKTRSMSTMQAEKKEMQKQKSRRKKADSRENFRKVAKKMLRSVILLLLIFGALIGAAIWYKYFR